MGEFQESELEVETKIEGKVEKVYLEKVEKVYLKKVAHPSSHPTL